MAEVDDLQCSFPCSPSKSSTFAILGDPGDVPKGESLPVGNDAGVRKILASASPASEESES